MAPAAGEQGPVAGGIVPGPDEPAALARETAPVAGEHGAVGRECAPGAGELAAVGRAPAQGAGELEAAARSDLERRSEGCATERSPGDARSSGSAKHFIPDATRDYLHVAYWDKRFEEEEEYEWCKDYDCFKHLLLRHVHPGDKVLILGCGNSRLTECLCRDGVHGIVSTDLSATVVRRMRARWEAEPLLASNIRWEVADMLDLPFCDSSFDVVIEKGAVDVFFVDNESPWSPSAAVRKRVETALSEAHRVLTPRGKFISISFGQPHFRRPLLEAQGLSWKMEYSVFGDTFHYFFYHMQKGTRDPSLTAETYTSKSNLNIDSEHEFMDDEHSFLAAYELGEGEP